MYVQIVVNHKSPANKSTKTIIPIVTNYKLVGMDFEVLAINAIADCLSGLFEVVESGHGYPELVARHENIKFSYYYYLHE